MTTTALDDVRARLENRKLFCQASMLVAEGEGRTYQVLVWKAHLEEIDMLAQMLDDVQNGVAEPAPNIQQERDDLVDSGVVQIWKRPRKGKYS